jgi:hypothetical protein
MKTYILIFLLVALSNGNAFSQVLHWAKAMSGSMSAEGRSVVLDVHGNVYSTGHFGGTHDFNPGPGTFNLTSAGESDIYVSKLNSEGNFVWTVSMGGGGFDMGNSIVVDDDGYTYITGYFTGTVDFDPDPANSFYLTGSSSGTAFVLKLDADGNFIWAAAIKGQDYTGASAITIDNAGSIYITGSFKGTVDFDPHSVNTYNLTSAGQGDIFILKLNPDGEFQWAGRIGGLNDCESYSIAADHSGNIYLTGYFLGTADLNPDPVGTYNLTSAGEHDIFISKLDADGNFLWAKAIGGGGLM